MATAIENKIVKKKRGRKKIPDYLVYEILGNKRIYYKDYKKVLSGELPPEAIMGSSELHAWIIDLILRVLYSQLNKEKYKILLGEVGYFYTSSRSKKWLNLDIAIVSREKLKKPQGTYLKVPPEVVIEVDTKADLSEVGDEYFVIKTEKLLKSGVKKVIWIFTDAKKIQIAENKTPWIIVDFDYEFEIIDNIKINLEKLLKEDMK
ncbi:Uma2 family endonuclease [Persephonella sp. KM09-Lau-8]|uniref:Uma2 family endonuclease n=1 Tax=Persephonella sp. KM09-Lau-8 TaxID=1158345 RepID=UPI0004962884|nr:Uma2 family endonuclease [Persephonella sp. KM09-Lau-8]